MIKYLQRYLFQAKNVENRKYGREKIYFDETEALNCKFSG